MSVPGQSQQEEIILCERRLEEVKDRAKKTEERLCAEITKCKDKATKTEAVLWEEILACWLVAAQSQNFRSGSTVQQKPKHRSVQPP